MKKVITIILKVFSIGISVCVLAGALSILGFLFAFCVGGELATTVCVFIHKTYFPYIIKATSIFTLIGLIGIYLKKVETCVEKNRDKKVQ